MSAPTFTRDAAKRWTREAVRVRGEHIDACGTVELTPLVEACADAFDQAHDDGPLDDHLHWIWQVALEVHDEHASGSPCARCDARLPAYPLAADARIDAHSFAAGTPLCLRCTSLATDDLGGTAR